VGGGFSGLANDLDDHKAAEHDIITMARSLTLGIMQNEVWGRGFGRRLQPAPPTSQKRNACQAVPWLGRLVGAFLKICFRAREITSQFRPTHIDFPMCLWPPPKRETWLHWKISF
jgi:hypothetical protein